MTEQRKDTRNPEAAQRADSTSRVTPAAPAGKRPGKSPSMHEGIAVWCDCCSCEAEPYWVEIAKEMGMELGSDYEDAQD